MSEDLSEKKIGRRTFLGATAAGAAWAAAPRGSLGAAEKTVKIGFLAPLTGEVAAWGLPGYYGCQIWADWINSAGGVKIGGDSYQVEFVPYDNEYAPDKARTGATKLIFEDEVKFIMMLGGDTWPAVQPLANRHKMLVSTLLPSDLSPDTPYLLAPCEVHPIYNVTGVWWLAENKPHLKTAVICAQDDALGRPSVATYRAAFEAHGIEVLDTLFFDISTTDFAPVMTSLMSKNPDIICLDTAYADFVHPLCEQAHQQGFKGQMISCTADFYEKIVEKTSEEFMDGFIFQFPDFDDPALNASFINFQRPNDFFRQYVKRWPGEWSAVSWEYPSIMDLWKAAAEKAGSVEPMDVLAAMKLGGTGKHAFGEARWWGKELFGIDNALVGNWPVVVIENGKATIKEFRSIPEWWDKHGDLLVKHFEEMGEMYYQRA
ncbi:MAG: ABC transporter substrate-binding protein [Gammaproteobacteria bacterium]|nr:ABC transporter substrate-binding protein [Gammaproteobacteria bacterium]NIR83392.1 ABC transporter substrate-binding protein [Gammaproteobacteria bacterium]NIR91314.1 ABC transporter substrate-binding protein [Gammaproteobacteria bacterium]NIU04554.1 ABC transporter substrate-binding protein [Gammaproteobacteria bacterium]NIV51596.1 ABC transporter substrate-binding protein [Gammaproteobacteria bacterium]